MGVLEALGEVLYTFHKDEGGPPWELVGLFLERGEERQEESVGDQSLMSAAVPTATASSSVLDPFRDDLSRALVRAFNFPAVSLTLGRARWDIVLRDAYLDLAANREVRVRRTLAASLGELARIVGSERARRDLKGVWLDAVRCEEEEVRMKAVEVVQVFVGVLCRGRGAGGAAAAASEVVEELVKVCEEGVLRGWRERECVAKAIGGLSRLVGKEQPRLVLRLLMNALGDAAAGVREIAIASVGLLMFSLTSDRILMD
jgi:serine/threonine-protein phosphatase 4 regulatory subunit 1